MFCYFWFDKITKEPYIGFSEGRYMKHPSLIAGSRKRIKIFNLNPNKDLAIDNLNEVLQEAIALY